jgi:hypothetical protein
VAAGSQINAVGAFIVFIVSFYNIAPLIELFKNACNVMTVLISFFTELNLIDAFLFLQPE